MSNIDPTREPVSSNDPDRIRAEIAETRISLSDDVNTLADTANPKNIARRQGEKARHAVAGVAEKVMGSPDSGHHTTGGAGRDAQEAVSGAAHEVGKVVTQAPDKAKANYQGSPLAAGLIAFGAGVLIASLIPASQREQRVVSDLAERAEPLTAEAKRGVQKLGENLQQPAQEAVESVKQTATEAADTVKGEASTAADDVRDQAQTGAANVRESRDN